MVRVVVIRSHGKQLRQRYGTHAGPRTLLEDPQVNRFRNALASDTLHALEIGPRASRHDLSGGAGWHRRYAQVRDETA